MGRNGTEQGCSWSLGPVLLYVGKKTCLGQSRIFGLARQIGTNDNLLHMPRLIVTTTQSWIQKTGTQEICPRGWGKPPDLYGERRYHFRHVVIAPITRQNRKRLGQNRPPRPPIVGRETRRQRHQISFTISILSEQLLSSTRCCVDYRRPNAGAVSQGESPGYRSRRPH